MGTGAPTLCIILFLTTAACSELSDKEILAFEVPKEIKKNFPFYLSGYDTDGAPIWIAPMGKYDFRRFIEKGAELAKALDISIDQCFLTMAESARNSTAKQFVFINDMESFDSRQVGHVPTVQMLLSKAKRFTEVCGSMLRHAWIVNVNFLWESFWPMMRPFFGALAKNIDTYGTNKELWKQKILKKVPRDQIPARYGGLGGHKHVKIMG